MVVEGTGAEAVGGDTETRRERETERSVQETKDSATSAGGHRNRDARGGARTAETIPAARSPRETVVT